MHASCLSTGLTAAPPALPRCRAARAGRSLAPRRIFSNGYAFAALVGSDSYSDAGAVVTWGNDARGGDSSAAQKAINDGGGAVNIFSTDHAFCAVTKMGTLVAWGDANFGGVVPTFGSPMPPFYTAVGNTKAFAAIDVAGAVVAWGDPNAGGFINEATELELKAGKGTSRIYATDTAFLARKKDEECVTWGNTTLPDAFDNSTHKYGCARHATTPPCHHAQRPRRHAACPWRNAHTRKREGACAGPPRCPQAGAGVIGGPRGGRC